MVTKLEKYTYIIQKMKVKILRSIKKYQDNVTDIEKKCIKIKGKNHRLL